MPLGGLKKNQEHMKLNGRHHLLVYTHYINVLGGSKYTNKKNTEPLAVSSNEIGLEVNAEKMRYMFMS
jgi:hypothetical protein